MATANETNTGQKERVVTKAVHDHWRLFLTEGIVLVILGSAAILVPAIASVAIALFLGWVFAAGGVVGLVATIIGHRAPGFVWSLISAVVALAVGLALIGWPISGTISLTFILTAFLVTDGVLMIAFG